MSAMHDIRRAVREAAVRCHTAQSGAVALLCLAGTLIIFMTALMMFDSGWASQEKMRVQTSADSAAFANAAVKARAMNSIAYMNVVKRSLAGMFEMYDGMMYFFRLTLEDTLACLAEVTEELADYESDLEGFDEEADDWLQNCEKNDDDDDDGNGPKWKSKKAGNSGGCEDDDAPRPPKAPGTTICPGCELVEGEQTFDATTFPDYTIFGVDMGAILEAMTLASSEQYCPMQEIFHLEATGDWMLFSGLDAYDHTPNYGIYNDSFEAIVTKFIRINLRSLTDFQDMLIMLSSKWAMAEAEQRGLFSMAKNVIPPENPAVLPLRRGTWLDMCLSRQGHVDANNKTGPELLEEISGNIRAHTLNSDEESGFTVLSHSEAGSAYMETPGCDAARNSLHSINLGALSTLLSGAFSGSLSDLLFGGEIGDERGHMFPYHNTEDEFHDFYMTYRKSKLTSGDARNKFGYMSADYNNADSKVPEKYEGMSCAETINLNPEYRMWRSSWAARIAPVEKCNPELSMHWK